MLWLHCGHHKGRCVIPQGAEWDEYFQRGYLPEFLVSALVRGWGGGGGTAFLNQRSIISGRKRSFWLQLSLRQDLKLSGVQNGLSKILQSAKTYLLMVRQYLISIIVSLRPKKPSPMHLQRRTNFARPQTKHFRQTIPCPEKSSRESLRKKYPGSSNVGAVSKRNSMHSSADGHWAYICGS
jgi:hypothetical protein